MTQSFNINALRQRVTKTTLLAAAAVLAVSGLAPILLTQKAGAAALTNRKVTISTSVANADPVNYTYDFNIPSDTPVRGIILEYCTQPLGACTLPAGMEVDHTNASITAQTFTLGNFAEYTTDDDPGACTDASSGASSTMLCMDRVDAGNELAAGAKSLTIGGIHNKTTQGTIYVRVSLYSGAGFTTLVHNGVVAAAMVDQLTVTGRVQERLEFCVAAVNDTDDLTLVATDVAECTAIADASVDIGIIDPSEVSMAPVNNDVDNQGEDTYGIAMINTNASSGTVLTFFAEPVGGEADQDRSFRVPTADCNALAATLTDQCFRSAAGEASGGTTVAAGNEYFGVYIPCIDTDSGTIATPMTDDDDFDGFDNDTAMAADCENSDKADNGGSPVLGWNDTSTASRLAYSNGVLDDVIVKLSFGATASATTPTGTYTVVTTYIATPTF